MMVARSRFEVVTRALPFLEQFICFSQPNRNPMKNLCSLHGWEYLLQYTRPFFLSDAE